MHSWWFTVHGFSKLTTFRCVSTHRSSSFSMQFWFSRFKMRWLLFMHGTFPTCAKKDRTKGLQSLWLKYFQWLSSYSWLCSAQQNNEISLLFVLKSYGASLLRHDFMCLCVCAVRSKAVNSFVCILSRCIHQRGNDRASVSMKKTRGLWLSRKLRIHSHLTYWITNVSNAD